MPTSLGTGVPKPHHDLRVPADLIATAERGLGAGGRPRKRVVIIGGGMAGLVAAFELMRQGHEPVVLEAQHRVGGRVLTLRDFAPGLYAEAGAMRIPRVHDLTLAYCELFGLQLRPFVMGNPKALVYIGGQRPRSREADARPAALAFDLAEHERGRTYEDLWNEATQEIRELYAQEGEDALDRICAEYDQYSIREFLRERGFSEGAIELYGVMSFRESNMNAAVVEQLREIVGRAFEDMQEIVGGMDLLPTRLLPRAQAARPVRRRGHAIEQDDHTVTVHYRTGSGQVHGHRRLRDLRDPVLGAARHRDRGPAFSREKQKAIRELNYNASTKILLPGPAARSGSARTASSAAPRSPTCRSGASATPRSPTPTTSAASCWPPTRGARTRCGGARCPRRSGSSRRSRTSPRSTPTIHDRVRGRRHPRLVQRPLRGRAPSPCSSRSSRRGCRPRSSRPEGRIHFAGEHCSLYHAWIQGALESGLSAARAIHEAA